MRINTTVIAGAAMLLVATLGSCGGGQDEVEPASAAKAVVADVPTSSPSTTDNA
jgi:hypothetical protein